MRNFGRKRRITGSITQEVRAVMKSGERDPKRLTEMIREIKERGDREIRDAVLPHQMERLRQVGFQTMIRSRDPVQVITSEPFATELGLDDGKKEQLHKRSQELREEFDRKVEALRVRRLTSCSTNWTPSSGKRSNSCWEMSSISRN